MRKSRRIHWATLLTVAIFVAVPVAVAIPYSTNLFDEPIPPEETNPQIPITRGLHTAFIWPGVRKPPARKADEVDLSADEPIVGISVQGRHRAYRLEAMKRLTHHVINDLIGDVPVTVTYCHIAKSVRTYTSNERGRPLEVWLVGYVHNQMLLKVGNDHFLQATGREHGPQGREHAPPALPHTLTTWGKWRAAYPDTEIVDG